MRPDGTVIVPTDNANETAVGAFNSINGGTSWSAITTIATITHHRVAGSLRAGPLPSAEIDGSGTVYVAWTDCRFRRSCKTNDIVLSHALNATGTSWSAVSRIPIDGTNSGVDHFIPGLAANQATMGGTAQLGLTYYFYPAGSAQLSVGFITSTNAGSTWSTPQTLATGMPTTWVATTSQGRMVGDYISTSYGADNQAHGIFATAATPTSGTSCTTSALDNCGEPMASFTTGLASGSIASANDPSSSAATAVAMPPACGMSWITTAASTGSRLCRWWDDGGWQPITLDPGSVAISLTRGEQTGVASASVCAPRWYHSVLDNAGMQLTAIPGGSAGGECDRHPLRKGRGWIHPGCRWQ